MSKYRLYIDESGTHKYPRQDTLWEKCLGLTGIIIEQEEYENIIQPGLRSIKRLFSDDPDDLPILHREDIASRSGVFKKLADPEFEACFNAEFLKLLRDANYTICCVVIDKKRHKDTYTTPLHPYHYCLTCLLERYTGYLETENASGDVMAESRGGSEDLELKDQYAKFYKLGNSYRSVTTVQKVLTSKELKMKRKIDEIEGLEFADLLAIPTKIDVLRTYGKTNLRDNFNKKIIDSIQDKYYKNWSGTVKGYGKKII